MVFFLIVICSGFGYLFNFFGLASSCTAHFVYDVAMFGVLKYAPHEHNDARPSRFNQKPDICLKIFLTFCTITFC